ncbi:MAG TPA: DNA recombination protein RmuC [Terriglobia bacterium]
MNDLMFAAVGLAVGIIGAWMVASSRLRKADHRAVAAEIGAEAMRLQQEADRQEILKLRDKLEMEQHARTAAETLLEAERKALEQQQRLLNDAQTKLAESFKALSGDVLASQSESFLQLARESFSTLRAQANGELMARHQAIEALVGPLGESLKASGDMIREMEKARAEAYGALGSEIRSLLAANETLERETGNLAAALKGGSQVRGRWGEMTLRRAVELAGMSEHCDFSEQATLQDAGGRSRPDMTVHLAGGRRIAVDAKAPLQSFLEAMSATREVDRRSALANYGRVVRAHMNQLGAKAYWDQLQPAPELVVMFLPGDSFLSVALAQEPTLIEDSAQKHVVIATPTTLITLLHAVAYGWRQERVEKSAKQISELGRQLYDRLRVFISHFAEAGSGLKKAVDAYNRAAGSLESRVLTAARNFKELGAAGGEDIPDIEYLDEEPRALQFPEPPEEPSTTPDSNSRLDRVPADGSERTPQK